jgi:hypothetical protein
MDVAVSGDHAFVADAASGLQVIDIGDPANPAYAGGYDTPGSASGVAVSGNYAYVADYDSGLQVIDISDPTDPSRVGNVVVYFASELAVSGDYAYLSCGYFGLHVIDISDPVSPSHCAFYDTIGQTHGVAVSGDYAYVASGSDWRGLQVIDISDPCAPVLAGYCSTSVAVYEVSVCGDYAFLANGTDGLTVLDIGDPTNPSLLSEYGAAGQAMGVAVAGDYAYVAGDYAGLFVLEVFQRTYDLENNVIQSVAVDTTDYEILRVSIGSTQIDSIMWECSADGGAHWQEVPVGADATAFVYPGMDLLWRSSHYYMGAGLNPSCSFLAIDVLYDVATIDSIADVPNDQGKQVRITWTGSGYDFPGSSTTITGYAIYRRIDNALASPGREGGTGVPVPAGEHAGNGKLACPTHPPRLSIRGKLAYPPGDWDYVTTVPARQEEKYAAVVPTLADSTIDEGMYYTSFFISALTETVWVYFDSPPDSGYSVDNLSPHVPLGFAVAYNTGSGNDLTWEECPDGDFQYFRIYRGESEDFDPSPGSLVHSTIETGWLDTVEEGWRYHYKITAVDYSGNESDAASPDEITGIDIPVVPKAFALYQNVPNPFNPATTIRFDLPCAVHVRLAIFDIQGGIVAKLIDGRMNEGRREIAWNATDGRGRAVASGVYFYRLIAGDFIWTRKMILLR